MTGGDPIFLQTFGDVGDLADIIVTSTSSTPSILTLIADGHLYSNHTQDFSLCVTLGPSCSGPLLATAADQVSGGTGVIRPQDPVPFDPTPIPEPSTALMLGLGLVGVGVQARRHRTKK